MKKYDNYKDSGIEWIGEIPEHWSSIKLKYVLSIQSGKGITNEQFVENGEFNIYGGNGILGTTDSYTNEGLDIIIGRVGALCGNIRLVDGKKWISDNALLANTTQNHFFIEKCLRVLDLNRLANKNAQPLITGTMVKDQYIGLPPLVEQTQIANYLDHKTTQIDTLISKKQQFITLLQEERTAVINQAVTKGLDPNVKMKDSGIEWLGEIPEHWEAPKLKFVCEFILDGTHGSHPRVEVGYRLLSVRNIINGKFVFREDDSCVSEEEYNSISKKFKINKDDIQLAIVGATLGKVALVDEMSEDFVTQRSLATIRSINSICIPSYLHNFMKSSTFQSYLWLNTGFSAQPGVYLGTLQNCTIPLPSISEQIEIVSSVNEIDNRIDDIISKSQQEIELLKEYKIALISEVVTGKIDVRNKN